MMVRFGRRERAVAVEMRGRSSVEMRGRSPVEGGGGPVGPAPAWDEGTGGAGWAGGGVAGA